MNNVDLIEKVFNKAQNVVFEIESGNKPGKVALFFKSEDSQKASEAYVTLQRIFPTINSTLLIKKNEKTIDISIINKETGDAINVKSVNYDINELDIFTQTLRMNCMTAFICAFIKNGNFHIISPVPINEFRPFLIGTYSIS